MGEDATKLLEEDVNEHSAITISDRRRFLEHVTGNSLSDSTVRRLLKGLGFSRKKDFGYEGTRRVVEGGLGCDGRQKG